MIQAILLGILLIGAVLYLGRMAYKAFTTSSCESGCGKCSSIDVDAIVKSARKSARH